MAFRILVVIVIGSLSSSVVSQSVPADCVPATVPNDCNFYTKCVEGQNECGEDGYALGYGHKYCVAFNNLELSQQGEQWITGTMVCLQGALVDYVYEDAACPAIKKSAFESHVGCYVDHGFCDLSLEDKAKISGTVIWDALTSIDGVNQSVSTLLACVEKDE